MNELSLQRNSRSLRLLIEDLHNQTLGCSCASRDCHGHVLQKLCRLWFKHNVIRQQTGEKLTSIIKDNRLIDIMRYDVADEEKVFSWWSYRNRDWKKSNRGRRLDHIWITRDLLDRYKDHSIFINTRDFTRPSDHVPVIIEI